MSAFTDWNGPPMGGPPIGRGPSTKDVLALIDAYNRMHVALSKHLETTPSENVHEYKTYIDEAVASLKAAVEEALGLKADADVIQEIKDTAAAAEEKAASAEERVGEAEGELKGTIDAETARAVSEEATLGEAIAALETALDEFKALMEQRTGTISFDDEQTTAIEGILAVTEYIIGTVKVRKLIDLVDWELVTATYAGTGANDAPTRTHGVYVLGRLSEEWIPDKGFSDTNRPKAARVYIKYINDRPFDLVADITQSGGENATITCAASFYKPWTVEDPDEAWEDMTLHIIRNTDSSGDAHLYLGISARGLTGQNVQFHIAGVNFIAGGRVNGISASLGFTRIKQGFNVYRANIDDLRVESVKDPHGGEMLSVSIYQNLIGGTVKDLYIGDTSYEKLYIRKRPYVMLSLKSDTNGDGEIDEDDEETTYVSPVLTAIDLDHLSSTGACRGIIVQWPQWEIAEVTDPTDKTSKISCYRAINYDTENFLALDGSTVSLEQYPTLRDIFGLEESATYVTLPVVDFSILRYTGLFDNVAIQELDGSDAPVYTNQELTEAIINLRQDLEIEEDTREEADLQLQANIDEEADLRAEADAVLQANIDAEEAARIEADDALQANIDAEEAARIAADEQLQANIDAEAQARSDADAQLQANIEAEAQARSDADAQLQANIEAEAQARADAVAAEEAARTAADAVLQANLDAETAYRTAADTQLQANIDAETVARIQAVSDEAQARSDADDTLQANIDAEAQARADADDALQANIDAEAQARADADDALQANIDAEALARQTADNTLQSVVNVEAQERSNADAALQTAIESEATARKAADTTLQSNIDAEEANRQTADNTLQANIDTEAQARSDADDALQNQIDSLNNGQ